MVVNYLVFPVVILYPKTTWLLNLEFGFVRINGFIKLFQFFFGSFGFWFCMIHQIVYTKKLKTRFELEENHRFINE